MGFWMKLSGFYLENMLTKLGVEGKCFLTVLLTCLTNRTATKQAMKTNFLQFILSFCTSLNVPVTHRSLNNTGRMLSMAKTTSSVTDWTVMASVVDVSFCSVVPAYFWTSKTVLQATCPFSFEIFAHSVVCTATTFADVTSHHK